MPPAPDCVHDFDVHVAMDAHGVIRVGGTETLNTPVATSSTYHFHPTTSPFHVTNVLTTYGKVVSSPGCTVDVKYDTKIPPVNGFHTGAIEITAHPDCGEGACIGFEFLDASYNAAGVCRVKFSNECAA